MDLKGQLSNPPDNLETLVAQGSRPVKRRGDVPQSCPPGPPPGSRSHPRKEEGRLSNPVQRRLTDTEVDKLVTQHQGGSTIETLAHDLGIHRTSVMAHLQRRAVAGRTGRKLSNEIVAEAARRYTGGETLAKIAGIFDVAPSTLTRELQLAGIPIRRRGRRPSA